jgi:hypothetical protein
MVIETRMGRVVKAYQGGGVAGQLRERYPQRTAVHVPAISPFPRGPRGLQSDPGFVSLAPVPRGRCSGHGHVQAQQRGGRGGGERQRVVEGAGAGAARDGELHHAAHGGTGRDGEGQGLAKNGNETQWW